MTTSDYSTRISGLLDTVYEMVSLIEEKKYIN